MLRAVAGAQYCRRSFSQIGSRGFFSGLTASKIQNYFSGKINDKKRQKHNLKNVKLADSLDSASDRSFKYRGNIFLDS